eukprot:1342341-Alexandrium_andersonii.AAC.1
MKERPAARRSTSWVLPKARDDEGAREPSASAATVPRPPQPSVEGTPAPATPYAAMNRLGWTKEQIEARKRLVDAGELGDWVDISEDPVSGEAFDDDAWGNFMAGEDGGADMVVE